MQGRNTRTRLSRWLAATALVLFGTSSIVAGPLLQPEAVVYKSPHCGCCVEWVRHLEEHGFRVKTVDTADMNAIKKRVSLPTRLASCHTAIVAGKYVIEGHVPAADILRLVKSGADLKGLAVPGMPGGSPGMEMAPAVPYDVLAFDDEGNVEVYAQYGNAGA